jgi:hypothetical protein
MRNTGFTQEILEQMIHGDLGFTEFPTENLKWVSEQLVNLVNQFPELRDSIPVLDSFAVAAADQAFYQLMTIKAQMVGFDTINTDSINALIDKNDAVQPTDQNEANLKLINDIYLNYFAQGMYELDTPTLALLTSVAQQCYVKGGPSVFDARSMYWIATGTSSLQFQDDCIDATDNFRIKTPSTLKETFKIYPNPLHEGQNFILESSRDGYLVIYDILGREIMNNRINVGINELKLKSDLGQTELLFYKIQNEDGGINSGKLILIK